MARHTPAVRTSRAASRLAAASLSAASGRSRLPTSSTIVLASSVEAFQRRGRPRSRPSASPPATRATRSRCDPSDPSGASISQAPQPGRPFWSSARAFIPRRTATTACAASCTAAGSRPALGFPAVAAPFRSAVQTETVLRRGDFVAPVIQEIKRVIVGQDYLINRLLIGLLCSGHLLIEGVPGLAKTLAVKTLADTIDADFKR